MALRARFALLLLSLAVFPWLCLFSQDSSSKRPSENAAPEQASVESNAKVSRTHCEVPACVQKILYFTNFSQPTDLQDVVNALRVITEIQRVQPIPGAQIIVIEGTAEQIAMGEKLAAEIDKAKRRFGGLGYRIDVKIQESEADKKLRSRLYSLVTEARQSAWVSTERQAPAPVQKDAGSETKPASESSRPRNVECRILGETEHTVEMSVEAGVASDAARETGGGASPLMHLRVHVTVELDKPTVIGRIDDPDSDRSYTIELTAARIKDKP